MQQRVDRPSAHGDQRLDLMEGVRLPENDRVHRPLPLAATAAPPEMILQLQMCCSAVLTGQANVKQTHTCVACALPPQRGAPFTWCEVHSLVHW